MSQVKRSPKTAEEVRLDDIERQLDSLREYAAENKWFGQQTRDVINACMAACSVLRPGTVTVCTDRESG